MTSPLEHPRVSVTVEGDAWFASARHDWNALLAASHANPLFLDWDWQHRWWRHFRSSLQAQLTILVARDERGTLLGIAPFHRCLNAARRPWRITQMAPLGNVWRQNVGEVTEHIDWIIRPGLESEVRRAIVAELCNAEEWDEILLSYTSASSNAAAALRSLAEETRCYVREEKPLEHYSVDTSRSFDTFTQELGSHTRQRLQGRRKLLARLGTVALVEATPDNLSAQLDKLDLLSRRRWGRGLDSTLRRFYDDLASAMLAERRLRFSTLEVDGRPISALFDVRGGDALYNIRSAIDTSFHKKLSPGLLHLGFAIEACCGDPGIERYELLAGLGKQTNFKRDIAVTTGTFVSLQLIRRPREKWLFKAYDTLLGR